MLLRGSKLAAFAIALSMSAGYAEPTRALDNRQAQLSKALKTKDYAQLQRLVLSAATPADVKTDLDWLRDQMFGGASSAVAMWYAARLWGVAAPLPAGPGDELRQAAAAAALYTYAAIRIDGTRCADVSAPTGRRETVLAVFRPIWAFVGTLSPEKRARLVDTAVKLDRVTAARRTREGDDAFLCRDGLDEIAYNLKRGTSKAVPTPLGGVGRTIATGGDGTYKPRVVAEKSWKPKAAQLRAELPQTLTLLVSSAR
ncbi:hypothetical protein GCM10010994_57030 [Chelatococcus reniformis]|uniref:Uncharacterized protein n=2 Tax=Chelatococcus reniformis TaxID=1494448 RepID=A0A916UWF7_9HYPH|nr:hypothetical protein GCM10010994_57030 [Chelatococcus reniformis]